jgi:pantetheine-phosphate adenylyltransferase
MSIAIYPGSFDPITNGHLDVVKRASRLFDQVIIAVYSRSGKPGALFTGDERVTLAQEAVRDLDGVGVSTFDGLAVEYARMRGATTIVRGLRAVSDFEYEFKMAHMNAHLAPEIDVVCLMTSSRHSFVSSSLIREVASLGGNLEGLVPDHVRVALEKRFAT